MEKDNKNDLRNREERVIDVIKSHARYRGMARLITSGIVVFSSVVIGWSIQKQEIDWCLFALAIIFGVLVQALYFVGYWAEAKDTVEASEKYLNNEINIIGWANLLFKGSEG